MKKEDGVHILAQHVSTDPEGAGLMGAYTGRISHLEISQVGGEGSLVGHSEIRDYLGETDLDVRAKFINMSRNGSMPLVCIGESFGDRFNVDGSEDSSRANEFIIKQVATIFRDLDPEMISPLVVAYEPRWAIGSGKSAGTAQVEAAHQAIRSTFIAMYGGETARKVRILYGGSVNLDNISELLKVANVDGALVGGVSARSKEFLRMAEIIKESTEEEAFQSHNEGRKPILAGNLKLYRRDTTQGFSEEYKAMQDFIDDMDLYLAVPYTLIAEFVKQFAE